MRATALAALIALAFAGSAHADGITPFRTPSGNIHCIYIEGDEGLMVDCEMVEIASFTLPFKRPADCDLDWGNRFTLDAEGKPQMLCYGDTVRDPQSKLLGYGKSIGSSLLSCTSQKSGLVCENQSGHGFLLSKAKQKFY